METARPTRRRPKALPRIAPDPGLFFLEASDEGGGLIRPESSSKLQASDPIIWSMITCISGTQLSGVAPDSSD